MIEQPTLFPLGFATPERKPKSIQTQELERVAGGISDLVLEFCRKHKGEPFLGSELSKWIELESSRSGVKAVPDSATRILRMLRKQGRINYEVVNRSASLYVVWTVGGAA